MTNRENHAEGVTALEVGGKRIILVATAHVSKQSAELAESVIKEEEPDTVCVELCTSRHQSIRNSDRWRQMDIVKVIKEKKAFLLLANMMLTSFQKRIGEKLGVRPGEEMIRALDAAEDAGAEICLADRDIAVTLSRTWRSTGLWNKIKLFFQMILSMGGIEDIDEQTVEDMKKEDILQSLLSELEKSHPSIRRILIDERDRYMAHKIRNAHGEKIVAVVGAGHVPGIKKYLYEEIDHVSLETVPPRGKGLYVFKWLLPAIIILVIAAGFYYGGAQAGKSMIFWWLAVNAVFAGLGAAAAFAHPATIVAALAAAPLTSLNPLIAAGWVAGLVEAWVRKPRVADLEDLPTDILSVKGFWRNKVTRILLIVVFANIGSSVGTFVALPLMVRIMGI
ncbi:MAG: TraB/GumN family protein [Desulfobacteraceae bacterium]|nr:TraB/GumN family protein [Desulfobacteraceae bacterium]